MLTRVLLALVLVVAFAVAASAEDAKIRGLGLTDHVVTEAELEKGDALPPPRFNSPGIAYVWASDLKKGDTVDITLNKDDQSLMRNTETLAEDKPNAILLVGKKGVPAGGWPEGSYSAEVKVSRERQDTARREVEADGVRIGDRSRILDPRTAQFRPSVSKRSICSAPSSMVEADVVEPLEQAAACGADRCRNGSTPPSGPLIVWFSRSTEMVALAPRSASSSAACRSALAAA